SITFVVAGLAGGAAIDAAGPGAVAWLLVLGAGLMLIASYYLPSPTDASAAKRRLSLHEAAKLLRSPLFLTFLLAAGAVHGSHGPYYTFGVLHWNSLGIPAEWIG